MRRLPARHYARSLNSQIFSSFWEGEGEGHLTGITALLNSLGSQEKCLTTDA